MVVQLGHGWRWLGHTGAQIHHLGRRWLDRVGAQIHHLGRRLVLIAMLSLLLGGCVDYQLGIQFDSQTHGTLIQTLRLDERFVALNSEARQQWLQVFNQEARTFSGQVTSQEDGTLQVRIDFNNGADLVKKFNQLFAANGLMTQVPGAPPLLAHLDLIQKNWGVALVNQLHADIDLTAIGADNSIGDGGALDRWRTLDLSFQVASPLLAGDLVEAGPDIMPGHSQQWPLRPGQLNTIDTTFWVPSPIGIGAVAIAILCGVGYGIRYGPRRSD